MKKSHLTSDRTEPQASACASKQMLLVAQEYKLFESQQKTCCWLLLLFMLTSFQMVDAQQPRQRTLKYDTHRKTWIEQTPAPPGTAEGDLQTIQKFNQKNESRQAEKAIEQWLKKYGANHARYPDILIAKAQWLIAKKKYFDAHLELQAYLSQFGKIPLTTEALRLEFIIAEHFLAGGKHKFLGILMVQDVDLAYRILDEISADYPDSRYAELAIKTKAEHLFQTGEHGLAELEYARLLKEHPRSRYHQLAVAQSAKAALASFAGVEYDNASLIEARERFHEYQRAYPAAAEHDGVNLILDSIRETRAEKNWLIAKYYERTDHISSAVYYYELVRKRWSGTIASQKATERLELMGVLQPVQTSDNP